MQNSSIPAIAQLAELQRLDRARREKETQIQSLEGDLEALNADIEIKQRACVEAREALTTAEARRREVESQLELEGTKIKDRRMRLNRVRNEKELQALRHEIEVSKEQNQVLEEEAIRLLEAIETLSAECQRAEEAFAECELEAADRKESDELQLATLRAELDSSRDGRQRVADALDHALLQRYELIFERRGGTAVVEVKNGICQGCRMSIPPQMYNELQKNPEVRLCPSCHRILYWQPEKLED